MNITIHLFGEQPAILLSLALFVIGIFFIVKGGDIFVDAASWMAEASGIPKLIVGATVVSFATTLPELLVSLFAASEGKTDMAIGNAVGSVTANIGLIMAIALIFIPCAIKRRDYLLKTVLMLGSSLILMILGANGSISFLQGILLLVIFAAAMFDNVRAAVIGVKTTKAEERLKINGKSEIVINILKFIFGAAAMVVGADLLVDNGSILASAVGISERVISVTIIAIGTSLPELVTTITAIVKKQASLSAGNILGANIIDMTLILPLSALVSGKALPVSNVSSVLDIPASLVVGAVAMLPALLMKKFTRIQGIALLLVYGAYVYLTCTNVLGL